MKHTKKFTHSGKFCPRQHWSSLNHILSTYPRRDSTAYTDWQVSRSQHLCVIFDPLDRQLQRRQRINRPLDNIHLHSRELLWSADLFAENLCQLVLVRNETFTPFVKSLPALLDWHIAPCLEGCTSRADGIVHVSLCGDRDRPQVFTSGGVYAMMRLLCPTMLAIDDVVEG